MAEKYIAGVDYVSINGQVMEVNTDSVSVPLTQNGRETLLSTQGAVGARRVANAAFVSFTAIVRDPTEWEELLKNTDLTITVAFSNGRNYVLSDAWCTDAPEFDGNAGTVQMRFEGRSGGFVNEV